MRDRILDWLFWLCQKTGHLLKKRREGHGYTWTACRICGSSLGDVKEKI